jgi:hypothetical protein
MARRTSDEETDGVLTQHASTAWRVIKLVAVVLGAGLTVIQGARLFVASVAADVVAPVSMRLDTHLAATGVARDFMERFAKENIESRKQMNQKLDALCRANPHANCPLGE